MSSSVKEYVLFNFELREKINMRGFMNQIAQISLFNLNRFNCIDCYGT